MSLFGHANVTGEDFFVSVQQGDDKASGASIDQAFRTINKAAQVAQAGDTVWIRGGTYREKVVVRNSGKAGAPITFAAYEGETVTLSSGDLLTNWKEQKNKFKGNLWKTNVDWDVGENSAGNNLFYDGKLKYEAGHHAEKDRLDADDWGLLPRNSIADGAKHVVLEDLRGFGDGFWQGAKITLQTLDWKFETRTIINYESKTGKVTFDKKLTQVHLKQDNIYRIHGFVKALDRPGEWFKHKGQTLYFWVERGKPSEHEIEFKRRAYMVDVRGREHIHIKGISFRGAAIETDKHSNHHLYQNNYFYGVGRGDVGRFHIRGNHNVIRENEFSHSYGSALEVAGTSNHIINNYFHDIGLTPTAKVLNISGDAMSINHNTFRRFARSVLDGYPVRSEVAHNLIEDGGRLSYDTGVFDSDGRRGNSSYTVFHHNVFRKCRSRGIMLTFYGRNNNAVIHHNLIYDWQPTSIHPIMRVQGSQFCQAYHNTIISHLGPNGVDPGRFSTDPETRVMARYLNNIQLSTELMEDIGKDIRGNHDYKPSDFQSIKKQDYRLRSRSQAIDRGIPLPGINDDFSGDAPDAGAIEFGKPMFKFGHDFDLRPKAEFKPRALLGTNVFQNGNFSNGIANWNVLSGQPEARDYNSWNLRESSLTGYFRTQSVALEPGTVIEKTLTGLEPNTNYTLGAAARLITELPPLTKFVKSKGKPEKGTYRQADFVTGLNAGSWVELKDIELGSEGQYDQIEIIYSRRDRFKPFGNAKAMLWLDNPQGGPLVEFDKLDDSDNHTWFGRRVRLPKVSGKHAVFVSASGGKSQNLALHRIRLVKSNLSESDKLTIEVKSKLDSSPVVTHKVGWTDWQAGFEKTNFRTGDGDTELSCSIRNEGRIDAYLDRLIVVQGAVPSGQNLVAYGCETSQSGNVDSGKPSLGADGDPRTFAETSGETKGSWWQARVPAETSFGRIVIVNRNDDRFDEMSNFRVSIWSDDRSKGGYRRWHKEYFRKKGSVAKGGRFVIDGDEISDELPIRLATSKGRIVRVELIGKNNAGNNRLSIAELELYNSFAVPPKTNVALGGKAQQSSNLYDTGRGTAELANNGIVNPEAEFTSTDKNKKSWWQVELTRPTNVAQIVLFNRTSSAERIGKFRVSLWNKTPQSGGRELWGRDYSYDARADDYSIASIGPGGALIALVNESMPFGNESRRQRDSQRGAANAPPASVVRIEKKSAGILSLAEVQVWAKQSDSK